MKTLIKIYLVILFALLTVNCSLLTTEAAVPHLINYQGRLTGSSGTPLSDGAHAITFRIFDAETAGNLLWQGTYSVTTQKGIFNVLLGDISDTGYNFSNLAFDKPYFLEIKVETEVMSPRQRIVSSGYAMRAEEAEKLGGKLPADYALASDITPTPTANKALRLDGGAKLPTTALKVYDSGWFAITIGTDYTKTHNLGTTKVLALLYIGTASDGTGDVLQVASMNISGIDETFAGITALSTTTIKISTGTQKIAVYTKGNNSSNVLYSGYARIIMLALE